MINSSHKVLKLIIRTFIVLAGLQKQYNRVTDCLLMHDALILASIRDVVNSIAVACSIRPGLRTSITTLNVKVKIYQT